MSKIKNCTMAMTVEEGKDREAWLAARNKGIGGSDAGIIMGASPWKSPYALWLEKTGQLIPEDISGKEPVFWGTKLEAVIADHWAEKNGKRVARCGTVYRNDCPWLIANVDRLVIGEKAGLEIKTTNAFNGDEWREDAEGQHIPDTYYWQCMHYMLVTGLPVWYVAVLIGGQQYVQMTLPRDEAAIQQLWEAEKKFWEENVLQKKPPLVDGSCSTADALEIEFPGGEPGPVDLTVEAEAIYTVLQQSKEKKKEAEASIKECGNKIKALMGDIEEARISGHKVTWKTYPGKTKVDEKKLQAEFPDVYEKVLKIGKETRVFRA